MRSLGRLFPFSILADEIVVLVLPAIRPTLNFAGPELQMSNRNTRRKLSVESLEGRRLLAGNVTAVLRGGDLILSGDTADNSVQVSRLPSGLFHIQGLEGTTVNGKPAIDAFADAHDIDVLMQQGGIDKFTIQGGFTLPGDLDVRLHDGNVLIEGSDGPVTIDEDLSVRTGPNGDVTLRNEVRVRGKTDIESAGTVNLASGRATLPTYASAKFSHPLTIDNQFFPLVQKSEFKYDITEGGTLTERIVVSVPTKTKTILGIQTQEVRDTVFRADGQLKEDTLDWYAQDDKGNVWYLGEKVTNYLYDDQGHFLKTTSGGTWEAGVNGAIAGIIMEAVPNVGDRYYQEFNANDVLDQAAVLKKGESVTVPKGAFTNLLRTRDTSVKEPIGVKDKLYAPGIGIVEEIAFDHITGAVIELTELKSVTLNGVEVSQLVSPTRKQGTNVTGRFVGGIRLDGAVEIDAAGAVAIVGATFKTTSELNGASEISLAESLLSGPSIIAADGTIGLRKVEASKRVVIKGAENVNILDSRFRREVRVVLGNGDSTLAVKGSVIFELNADGGLGHNVFDDQGSNSNSKLKLKRFS